MKATITIHFPNDTTELVLAKCQQWCEFLQTAGINATFLISPDDQPIADLWQALNEDHPSD